MYKQIKLQVPTTPTYILTEDLKQPIAIEDLSEDELRQLGTEWTQDLLRKARLRRGSTDVLRLNHLQTKDEEE